MLSQPSLSQPSKFLILTGTHKVVMDDMHAGGHARAQGKFPTGPNLQSLPTTMLSARNSSWR